MSIKVNLNLGNQWKHHCPIASQRSIWLVLPKMWHDVIYDEQGQIRTHYWEMGFYYALKKEISAGDIYLSNSRNNRYFWDTVYGALPWEQEREQQYQKLKLPSEFDAMMESLSGEYHQVAIHARNRPAVTVRASWGHFVKNTNLKS